MMNAIQHPEITSAEITGYPSWRLPHEEPHCPCCGSECETIYFSDRDGTILGCDNCITVKDAWEVDECYEEEAV